MFIFFKVKMQRWALAVSEQGASHVQLLSPVCRSNPAQLKPLSPAL
jgi:hypothetical protein